MANVLNGNTYYVDAASTTGVSTTYLASKDVKVIGIIRTIVSGSQTVVLSDLTNAGAAGTTKLQLHCSSSTSSGSEYINLHANPIRFPNGVFINSISGGTMTLILELKA